MLIEIWAPDARWYKEMNTFAHQEDVSLQQTENGKKRHTISWTQNINELNIHVHMKLWTLVNTKYHCNLDTEMWVQVETLPLFNDQPGKTQMQLGPDTCKQQGPEESSAKSLS